MSYLKLFIDALTITSKLVIDAFSDILKFLVVCLAAALPLFIVIIILFAAGWVIANIVEVIKHEK